jgi:3-phenylpropionate/trans-cinnamate dioxygenase ferredoxin reductase component
VADRRVDVLIAGAGGAGSACAEGLREAGFGGSLLLAGRDVDPPYERPFCSKEYLRGDLDREGTYLSLPEPLELLTRTSVTQLDTEARTAKLSSGEQVGFGRALLAPGANVRRLRVDGGELDGIYYIRAFGNSDALKAAAQEAERAVIVGGSYIGTEVAASLTAAHGVKCTMVMLEEITLERFYGKEVGGFFQGVLEEHGVEVHGGDELERFEGSDGRVRKVVTKGGLELDCDLVVIGAGVTPDVSLAKGAGLELGEAGGVLCSAGLESSAPGIYAAGDICEYDSPVHGRHMRIEHWDVAFNQGKTAGLNMLGQGIEHDVVPYFFSDLADWSSMEYVGPGSGETVVRGSLADGDFTAFYVDDGRVTAALTVGRSDDLEHAQRFIVERTAVDQEALADEGTDLAAL